MKKPRIDKSIPIPTLRADAANAHIVKAMAVGDSYLAPNRAIANSIWTAAKRMKRKVKTRMEDDGVSVRVWRVK